MFAGLKRPAVVEDGEVAGGQVGEGFEAVFGDGAEGVESVEGGEGEGDGGLEGGYAHVGYQDKVGRSTAYSPDLRRK